MPQTDFLASKHGFHFSNHFANRDIGGLDVPFKGRCGGMSYAALDYYESGLPVPTHISQYSNFHSLLGEPDFAGTNDVPPDGTQLAEYIWTRQEDSVRAYAPTWINLVNIPDKRLIDRTKRVQWETLERHLADGPIPIGLIPDLHGLQALPNCHVVIATGCERRGDTLRIFIYDCKFPDRDDIELVSTSSRDNPHWNELEPRTAARARQDLAIWRGFFVHEGYRSQQPHYRDLVVKEGLSITPAAPRAWEPIRCSYTVRNDGRARAHLRDFRIFLRSDRPGEPPLMLRQSASPSLSIEPGEERVLSLATNHCPSGAYTVEAAMQTLQNHVQVFPAKDGARATAALTVLPAPSVLITASPLRPELRPSAGKLVGGYRVVCAAEPAHIAPTETYWQIDPMTPIAQIAAGSSVDLFLPVGSSPGPYHYDHEVKAHVRDDEGRRASAALVIRAPQPEGALHVDYEHSRVAIEHSSRGGDAMRTRTTETAYAEVTVRLAREGFLGAVSVDWTPADRLLRQSVDEATFAVLVNGAPESIDAYHGFPVQTRIVDEIGQTVHLELQVDAVRTVQVPTRPYPKKRLKIPIDLEPAHREIGHGPVIANVTDPLPRADSPLAGDVHGPSLADTAALNGPFLRPRGS